MAARAAERTGGDVDASPVQALHSDLEALAFFADAIAFRHPAVGEHDLRGRLTVPAHFAFLGAEGQTGRVLLDQNAGNTASPLAAGARHHRVNIADTAAGNERLAAIQDIMAIAVVNRARRL